MKEKVAIVGFGVCGRVAALMLAKHYDVHVFECDDRFTKASAGYVAAAMLAPLAESVHASTHVVDLGTESLDLWPKLLAQLETEVFFQRAGTLVVAHAQDQGAMAHFRQHLKPLENIEHKPRNIDHAALVQLEPQLSVRFTHALHLPNEGQLDNLGFYQHSYATLKKRGAHFHFDQQICPHKLDNGLFNTVVDCRGLGAKHDIKLRGVRGEVARVIAPEVHLTRPVRLMHPRYPIYIAPKPHNRFVIGATEIESDDLRPTSVRSALELLSAAYSVHSGFAEAHIEALQVGLRPATLDHEPYISKQGNVISINGLYRHGFMIAPALVKQALAHMNLSM
ncbi:FAD-dependent oxidoreductase [Pseudoalteromonas sp. SSDWG2]|uniref:FAD-dependent oxidoreductase n=1 Tax=Pseudoalteromonas sp. SSDWG2 TaxID=3139391 RepID=UPI003BABFA75